MPRIGQVPGRIGDLKEGAAADLTVDLVTYWKLDEDTSANRLDSVGTAHFIPGGSMPGNINGIIAGCQTLKSQQVGAVMQSNLQTDVTTFDGTVDASLVFWVKEDFVNDPPVPGAEHNGFNVPILDTFRNSGAVLAGFRCLRNGFFEGNNRHWQVGIDTLDVTIGMPISGPDFEYLEWFMITMIYSAGAGTLTVTGSGSDTFEAVDTTISSQSLVTGPGDGTTWMQIGGNTGGTPNGFAHVDEMGLWRRALSVEDRTFLWNSGAGRTYPFT